MLSSEIKTLPYSELSALCILADKSCIHYTNTDPNKGMRHKWTEIYNNVLAEMDRRLNENDWSQSSKDEAISVNHLDRKITELGLSTRAFNSLKYLGEDKDKGFRHTPTVRDVLMSDYIKMRKIRNFGPATWAEVWEKFVQPLAK